MVNVNKGLITLNPEDLFNLVALYDGEVAYTDSQIGRLLAGLRRRGITEDALVILVADHGEEFLDHGKMGHAHSLYQELVNVPLIISGRGFPRALFPNSPRARRTSFQRFWAGVTLRVPTEVSAGISFPRIFPPTGRFHRA